MKYKNIPVMPYGHPPVTVKISVSQYPQEIQNNLAAIHAIARKMVYDYLKSNPDFPQSGSFAITSSAKTGSASLVTGFVPLPIFAGSAPLP